MKTYSQLENELADAINEIKWLREDMAPPEDFRFRGPIRLSRSESIVLYTLATSEKPLTVEHLRKRIDIVLNRVGEYISPQSVVLVIHRLRKRLTAWEPPIVIRNDWGVGFYLDDENKGRALRQHVDQGKIAA